MMASPQQQDGDSPTAPSKTVLDGLYDILRNTKITQRRSKRSPIPFTSATDTSCFASPGNTDDESCWAKAARKNGDKGHKTWRTFDILEPLYDPNTRVTKPMLPPPQLQIPMQAPGKRPTKKQMQKQLKERQAWWKGLHEAQDTYGYINGLSKPDEMDLTMTALAAEQSMTLKHTVENAGEFYEWEGEEGEGGWEGKGGEWEWQGAGGQWEDVPEWAAEKWRENCDDEDPFLNK